MNISTPVYRKNEQREKSELDKMYRMFLSLTVIYYGGEYVKARGRLRGE